MAYEEGVRKREEGAQGTGQRQRLRGQFRKVDVVFIPCSNDP